MACFWCQKNLVFLISMKFTFSMPKKFTFHDSVNPTRHCWHTGCPRTYLIHILDFILTIYPFLDIFIQILDGPIWTWFWHKCPRLSFQSTSAVHNRGHNMFVLKHRNYDQCWKSMNKTHIVHHMSIVRVMQWKLTIFNVFFANRFACPCCADLLGGSWMLA